MLCLPIVESLVFESLDKETMFWPAYLPGRSNDDLPEALKFFTQTKLLSEIPRENPDASDGVPQEDNKTFSNPKECPIPE
jgi:hypothetical protein